MDINKTPIQQLLDLIPDADEIITYMFEYQPDTKMLDNWLYERIYKGRDWANIEKEYFKPKE
jgi:hypothetical protein